MSILEAGIAAGGSLIGGILTNEQNKRMAREQMAFQERMSSTAHQREVKDLREAGLNPILSAKYGGSSSPSGAMATMENVLGEGVASAIEARRLKKEIDKVDSEVMVNEAVKLAQETAAKRDSATAKQIEAQTKLIKAQVPVAQKQSQWDLRMMDYDNVSKRLHEGMGILNSAKDAMNLKQLNPHKDFSKPRDGFGRIIKEHK